MKNWYKQSQVAVTASIKISAGYMRQMPTTVGPTTDSLDNICYILNDYAEKNTRSVEEIRKVLNGIADGGITINVDRNGYINVDLNPKEIEQYQKENTGDFTIPE